jgi:hypothetical protein
MGRDGCFLNRWPGFPAFPRGPGRTYRNQFPAPRSLTLFRRTEVIANAASVNRREGAVGRSRPYWRPRGQELGAPAGRERGRGTQGGAVPGRRRRPGGWSEAPAGGGRRRRPGGTRRREPRGGRRRGPRGRVAVRAGGTGGGSAGRRGGVPGEGRQDDPRPREDPASDVRARGLREEGWPRARPAPARGKYRYHLCT